MLSKLKITNIIIVALLMVCLLLALCLGTTTPVSEAYEAPQVFNGPYFYTGLTTTTYQYYSVDASASTDSSTIGTKTIVKTDTVTEEQVLPYFLHTPINYDKNKNYPILTYCSGDGITVFTDDSFYNENDPTVDFSSISESSPFYTLVGSYLQTNVYKDARWDPWGGCAPYNSDGTVNTTYESLPHYCVDENNWDDYFIEKWYDLVYNQGKEEYDCFIIFLNPTDRFWYQNTTNKKLVNIQNQGQSSELFSKYGSSLLKGYGESTSTYISSEISANVYEQLLTQLIDSLAEKYSIDLSRQYLAGFSLGAIFSYDTACHYPNRFACVMTSGLPSVDLTDENCKNWANTNFWAFNGNGDFCDKNGIYVTDFIAKVNSYKTSENSAIAKNTVIDGYHNGKYIAGQGTYIGGAKVDSTLSTYDFMFESVREDICSTQLTNDKQSVEDLTVSAKASTDLNSDGTYNIVLVSGAPLGDYNEHGFVVTTNESKSNLYEATKKLAVSGMVKTTEVSLGSEIITLKATDYHSAFLYNYTISNIPASVGGFKVKAYAKSQVGEYYSDEIKINISIIDNKVYLEVV